MNLYISRESALPIWRSRRFEEHAFYKGHSLPKGFVPSLFPTESKWLSETLNIRLPVCCTVSYSTQRWQGKNACYFVDSEGLPREQYIHLGKSLFCVSPQIMFAQLCMRFARNNLINSNVFSTALKKDIPSIVICTLMMEFGGNYRLDSTRENGFREARKLISEDSLKKILSSTGKFYNKKHFRDALLWMSQNSSSPMETIQYLLLRLPKRLGGYGVSSAICLNNKIITLHKGFSKFRYADLCLTEEKIILEYNGSYHEGERANEDDKRRNELIACGYQVITINSEQLLNINMFEETIAPVLTMCKHEGRKPSDYKKRQVELRMLLFGLSNTRCMWNKLNVVSHRLLE